METGVCIEAFSCMLDIRSIIFSSTHARKAEAEWTKSKVMKRKGLSVGKHAEANTPETSLDE